MRSLNDFADTITKSYALHANAQKAIDRIVSQVEDQSLTRTGASVVVKRTDGRFVAIFVNPHHFIMLHLAQNGFGVYGITS